MKFIIGKKLDMTQVWKGDKVIAVTRVKAGPCVITQVKNTDKDAYSAIQVGFGQRKVKNINKPQRGHLKKVKAVNPEAKTDPEVLRELRCSNDEISNINIGDVINAATFEPGDRIEVTAFSKGRGFQGVVKRHGFHGQDKTHGNKDQERMPGSIGAQDPQRVFKGLRMSGHMGDAQVTTKNLEIVEIDAENNILLIKGAVPGAKNGLVVVKGEGELKVTKPEVKAAPAEEAKVEETEPAAEEKVEEKKEEVAEEVKEAPKAEEPKAEAAPEPKEKEVEEAPAAEEKKEEIKEDYVAKFEKLPAEMKEKVSKPEVMGIINGLEEKYGVDLVSLVMKVAVKEMAIDSLNDYFKTTFSLTEENATRLADELKEKIFAGMF